MPSPYSYKLILKCTYVLIYRLLRNLPFAARGIASALDRALFLSKPLKPAITFIFKNKIKIIL